MLIKLTLNNKKVEKYNQRMRELKIKYPDLPFREIEKLEEMFCPYAQMITDKGWAKYKPVAKDNRPLVDLHGIYVCGLNDEEILESITDYKVVNHNSYLYWCKYGVADNASQVLDYYEHFLLTNYSDYMNNHKFIIKMTPIFKENQPEHGGWRWHKWGEYIGDFISKCEYLYDEQGIDYVWVFAILEVEECEEEF